MSALVEGVPSTLLVVWRKVRQLLPVYAAIAESFGLAPPPCADISAIDTDDDLVLQIAGWIEEIDSVSQPHHLRTVLQELDICSSEMCVSTWLQHFVSKPVRGATDRDKIDFLLSHYLRMNLPPSLQEGRTNYAAMKAVLEPVLGSCDLPDEAREIDELIGIAERCRSLAEFEHSGIIRRGRELKLRAGESYFTAPFLLAFTHFNAVVRRECHRLMNSDLKFIGEALKRLEQQGITHIDCTAANWSDREPVGELQNKWATWELASNDYSQDFFANLIAFRSSVEEALERCIELSMTSVSQELRSIHTLLLEMRSQIDELPRRFGQIAVTHASEHPAAAPVKPVLVWQANAKPHPEPSKLEPAAVQAVHAIPAKADEMPAIATATAPAAIPVAVRVNKPVETPEVVKPAPQEPTEIQEPKRVEPAAPTAPAAATVESSSREAASSGAAASPEVGDTTGTPTAATIDLEAGIAHLQKTLCGKRPTAVSIAVAGTRILLTAAEASMFSQADNRYAKGVQRAVMMRICLVSALETHSKTRDKSNIAALVPVGRTERTTVQELIAECKAQKLAREEEILSATAKQMAAMLERAERIAR